MSSDRVSIPRGSDEPMANGTSASGDTGHQRPGEFSMYSRGLLGVAKAEFFIGAGSPSPLGRGLAPRTHETPLGRGLATRRHQIAALSLGERVAIPQLRESQVRGPFFSNEVRLTSNLRIRLHRFSKLDRHCWEGHLAPRRAGREWHGQSQPLGFAIYLGFATPMSAAR